MKIALYLLGLQGLIGAFDTLYYHEGKAPIPGWTCISLSAMGIGVLASGFRDLYAALALPGSAWPWKVPSRQIGDVHEYHALMGRLKHIDAMGPYSRDEMNER